MKNKFISAPDMTLDIVYTYVNTTDEEWVKKVRNFKPSYGNNLNKQRFNFNNEIYFSLRTVQKFMPWVRNIYIVHDNQKFELNFLNDDFKKKIKFIDHASIIPHKYLPIFNSMLIELFIANIKGLSDYFLYLNDDVFIGNYLTQNFFFDKNRVFKQYFKDRKIPYERHRLKNEPHLIRLINVHDLVRRLLNKKKFYISTHGGWHLNKYTMMITFKTFRHLFEKMLKTQKFRTYNNDTYEFLTLSSIISEELKIVKTSHGKVYQIQDNLNESHIKRLFKIKPKMFVINKLDDEQLTSWNYLIANYLKMFNNKKYNNIKEII